MLCSSYFDDTPPAHPAPMWRHLLFSTFFMPFAGRLAFFFSFLFISSQAVGIGFQEPHLYRFIPV